ncbi:MAG: energy-coupling factor transporter transmembrane component T [Asgard group archaeon]|nr:energy-coupling factor transporter transmembrane component T [Asgard group archaeon]
MSMAILDYFIYQEEKSLLHKIDPRVKLLFVIAMMCLTIIINNLFPIMLLFGLILPLLFLGEFFLEWFRSLLVFLPFLLLIIILNAFLLTAAHPTTLALIIAFRLLIISAVFGLFFQTVSPNELSLMLISFHLPYSLAWAMSTAYRFIPTLADETTMIANAQKARGLQIDQGHLIKRVKNFLPLLIPIFASALRRSWQLAEAIESRGWNARKKRTFLYKLEFQWWDGFILFFSLGILAVFFYLIFGSPVFPKWWTWTIPAFFELPNLFTIFWQWFVGLFS